MLSQELATRPHPAPNGTMMTSSEDALPLALLELELSLEGFTGDDAAFCDAVRKAAAAALGEFLFDLPAAGLVADCRRIAVIRIPAAAGELRLVLALLDEDGAEIHLQAPDEETEHLVRFADAFVNVLERMPEPELEHS